MAPRELPRSEKGQSVVTIQYPEGREFLWLTSDSPVLNWQIGEAVVFKNSPWVVLGRTEQAESLSLTLGGAAQ